MVRSVATAESFNHMSDFALDLDTLASCLTSSACLVTQTTSGFIIGMLLFLVPSG